MPSGDHGVYELRLAESSCSVLLQNDGRTVSFADTVVRPYQEGRRLMNLRQDRDALPHLEEACQSVIRAGTNDVSVLLTYSLCAARVSPQALSPEEGKLDNRVRTQLKADYENLTLLLTNFPPSEIEAAGKLDLSDRSRRELMSQWSDLERIQKTMGTHLGLAHRAPLVPPRAIQSQWALLKNPKAIREQAGERWEDEFNGLFTEVLEYWNGTSANVVFGPVRDMLRRFEPNAADDRELHNLCLTINAKNVKRLLEGEDRGSDRPEIVTMSDYLGTLLVQSLADQVRSRSPAFHLLIRIVAKADTEKARKLAITLQESPTSSVFPSTLADLARWMGLDTIEKGRHTSSGE